MARNPYYKDDTIRVDLRDLKGRHTSLSKAAYFYIYVENKLVERFEFSSVSLRVAEKENEIREILSLFREILDDGITKPKEIREELEEEFYDEEDEEEYEEEFDELPVSQQNKLAKLLEQDLVDILLEEEPSLVHVPGKKYEYAQEITSRSFNDKTAYLQKFEYFLKPEVVFTLDNIDDLENFIESNLSPVAEEMYKECYGEHMFIMRLMIDRNIGGKEIESTGIGTFRTLPQPFGIMPYTDALKNAKENLRKRGIALTKENVKAEATKLRASYIDMFHKLVTEELEEQVSTFKGAYLLGSVDNKLIVKGFSLENLVDVEIPTEEELMTVYSNSKAEAEKRHDKKIKSYRADKRLKRKAYKLKK